MPFKPFKKSYNSTIDIGDAIYLVIVESPSKCKKIEQILGPKYKCIASNGHLFSIQSLANIDSNTFFPKFDIISEKSSHHAYLKTYVSKFVKHNIFIATDDDREGEAIAFHLIVSLALPYATKRILFHDLSKESILKSFETPTQIDTHMVLSQFSRQVLDMIIGYKISPFLWKFIYNDKKNGLSAGRCQTPALRLVYDNEKLNTGEIETKYKTTGNFFTKNILFQLQHDFIEKQDVIQFLEKSKTFQHTLSLTSPKESVRAPPKPYNTSALLQSVSNALHYSPKETMSLCQQLYQAGHITYMRTENRKYSKDFIEKASKYILQKWENPKYIGKVENLQNLDDSNPHEAIRVTNIEYSYISGLEGKLSTLYHFIWKNTVESCMSDAIYNCVNANMSAPDKHKYNHIIEIPLFLGWKIVSDKGEDSTQLQNTGNGLLFFFQSICQKSPGSVPGPGPGVSYNSIESIVTIQHKHSHYTESSLIQKLEEFGIGRPSTFAMIVDTIQERGYVKKCDIPGEKVKCSEFKLVDGNVQTHTKEKLFGNEKNKLVIEPMGTMTLEFLIEHFDTLFSYEYTSNMEEHLDKIAKYTLPESEIPDPDKGIMEYMNFLWTTPSPESVGEPIFNLCKKCTDDIKSNSKSLTKLKKQAYKINDEYDLVFHRYGASLRKTGENDEIEYKSVKKDLKIDLEKLKNGEYRFEDLVEIKNDYLGKYENCDMFLRNGKFGPYVEWGDKKQSVKLIQKPISDICMDDIEQLLAEDNSDLTSDKPRKPPQLENKSILRVLNSDMSIRKGKFGPYVYFMPSGSTKPAFFGIGKYSKTYNSCDVDMLIEWVVKTYINKS
jgi:DNA topoisomerase-1